MMGSLGESSQNVGVQSCYFNAIGHNVRGLSDGKLEELVRHMEDNDIFLVCLQETWRLGDFRDESHGYLFINHGGQVPHGGGRGRNSGGVGFLLNPTAKQAFEYTGSKILLSWF